MPPRVVVYHLFTRTGVIFTIGSQLRLVSVIVVKHASRDRDTYRLYSSQVSWESFSSNICPVAQSHSYCSCTCVMCELPLGINRCYEVRVVRCCQDHVPIDLLQDFHARYYHPSNARIWFYGDDDPEERLRLLSLYLDEFDARQVESHCHTSLRAWI